MHVACSQRWWGKAKCNAVTSVAHSLVFFLRWSPGWDFGTWRRRRRSTGRSLPLHYWGPAPPAPAARRTQRHKDERGNTKRKKCNMIKVVYTWLLSTLYPCFSANVLPSETDMAYPTMANAKASPITSPKRLTSGTVGERRLVHRYRRRKLVGTKHAGSTTK